MKLSDVRAARGLTQQNVADVMGVTASRVGIFENQSNRTLETMGRYIEALGGRLIARARFADISYDLDVGELGKPENIDPHR